MLVGKERVTLAQTVVLAQHLFTPISQIRRGKKELRHLPKVIEEVGPLPGA